MSDVDRDTRCTLDRRQFGDVPVGGSTGGTGPHDELLRPPRLPSRLVPRPALARRLDRRAAVSIVEALPGFGKTTFVASWARSQQQSGARVIWLRATPDLDDPGALFALLRGCLVRTLEVHQDVHAPRQGAEGSLWIDQLLLPSVPLFVVIDDAHLLRDPGAADILLEIAVAAHNVHVVVCSDTHHHFHEAAARHRLETNVLRARDLSVSAPEILDFAAAWGHRLEADAAAALHDLVGGWLLPLRLVLDATPRSAGAFATHVAHEFVTRRVLSEITPHADIAVAMRYAVPERLDLDLATTLLDDRREMSLEATSELAISALERQGLLWRVPRHDHSAVWRFPPLVRRALLDSFTKAQPEEVSAVHRSVARLLAGRGDARAGELLRHARSSGEWALLDRLWAERGWSLVGADPDAFSFAYSALPSAAIHEFGALALAGSLADALSNTTAGADWMQRVETLLQRYMQAGTDFLGQSQKPQSHRQLADMLTAAMIARRTEGRLEEACGLAKAAEREYGRARLADPERPHTSQSAWFHLQSAITQMQSGRYAAALEACSTSYQVSPSSLVGSGASALMAAMHAFSAQADDTRHWLCVHEELDVSQHWAAGLAQLPARIARAMLALDQLDAASAEAEIEATMLGSEASGLWPLVLAVRTRHALLFGDPVAMLPRLDHLRKVLARHLRTPGSLGQQVFDRSVVELLLALGEVNRAQSLLGEGHALPAWQVTPAARLHLMTGNSRAAVQLASSGAWRRDIYVRDQQQLLVIKALALHDLGEHPGCQDSIQRAQAIATDTGNLEPFLLIPPELRTTLLTATGVLLDPVTAELVNNGRPIYPARAELIQLSPRELEVLRQIHGHDTVAGLARSLSVSVNTVKKQLVSLYAKLDVHDRSSALLRAQSIGLLHEPDTDRIA